MKIFELLFLVREEAENDFGTLWRRTGRDDDIRTPLPRTLFNRSSYNIFSNLMFLTFKSLKFSKYS